MFIRFLKKILSANQCNFCLKETTTEEILCLNCLQGIRPIQSICHKIKSHLIPVHSLGAHEGILKDLIHTKYSGNNLFFEYLGTKASRHIQELQIPIDYILYIPMHPMKQMYRWFNQSKIFAESIGQSLEKPLYHDVSAKFRWKHSAFLKKKERLEEVNNIFDINYLEKLRDKNLLIVDDVYTTGATMNSFLEKALKAKPQSISVYILSRKI
jgi:competence protein ComFC